MEFRAIDPTEIDLARFMSYVAMTGECHVWMGCRTRNGYGQIGGKRRLGVSRMLLAHRVSHELFKGPIPTDKIVLHRCDNRACVRPSHLQIGSQSENIQDSVSKGRYQKKGEKAGKARLKETQVREIRNRRAAGESPSQLAAEYGVMPCVISNIAARRIWKHI